MDGSCVDGEGHDLGDKFHGVPHASRVGKDGYYSKQRVKKKNMIIIYVNVWSFLNIRTLSNNDSNLCAATAQQILNKQCSKQ